MRGHGRDLGTLTSGAALAAAALVLAPIVSEAVLVSPHAVFIDGRTRTAQVFLINTGSSPEEVEVALKFGYPDTDSMGNIFVRLFDEPPAGQPSAAAWVRAFPRRVVVQPGERQVVRLLAQPPSDLAPGEYWSRLIVTAKGAQVDVEGADSLVRAGISLVVSTIISVTYRSGELTTGVRLDSAAVADEGDSLVARVAMVREGNAAYLGTLWVRLKDAAGRVVREWDTPIGLYHGYTRRLAFGLDSVVPGAYQAELELTTRRGDLPANVILPAAPVLRTLGEVVVR